VNFLRLMSRNKPRTGLSQADVLGRIDEDLATMIGRNRFMGESLQIGPNWVHAMVGRGDSGVHGEPGTFEDLGWNHNYRPTAGMDWIHNLMGGLSVPTTNSPATSITATAVTGTGSGLTTDALKGFLLVMPITGLTTKPVHAHILSNSTSVIQVGAWHNEDCSTGTTPAGTSAYIVLPGQGPAKFIGLTNDATAYSTGMTTLAAEITANGLGRALATFAHTGGTTTYTLVKTWTATGAQTVHRAGNFTGDYGASGGGIMAAITDLNADATLATNDTLQVTWTWTLPSAGA
jgi:hypothetical protein